MKIAPISRARRTTKPRSSPPLWRPLAAIALGVALLAPQAVIAQSRPPVIGEVLWQKDVARCGFVRAEAAPAPAEPDTALYVFVTELASDDTVSVERGYMRIDGLLRELEFLEDSSDAESRVRRYRTFGDAPVSVALEIGPAAGEGQKSELTGSIAVANSARATIIGVRGSCRS